MASSTTTPPALLEATQNSTSAWQDDLQALFEQAKERFPDVVWELSAENDIQGNGAEEVWGHKGALKYISAAPDDIAWYLGIGMQRTALERHSCYGRCSVWSLTPLLCVSSAYCWVVYS